MNKREKITPGFDFAKAGRESGLSKDQCTLLKKLIRDAEFRDEIILALAIVEVLSPNIKSGQSVEGFAEDLMSTFADLSEAYAQDVLALTPVVGGVQ